MRDAAHTPSAAVVLIAALSSCAIGLNGAFVWAGAAIERGAAALASAAPMARGAARDRLLDEAQAHLRQGLTIARGDARAWDLLAEVRWLQATGADVRDVSPTLLTEAERATRQAQKLAPAAAAPGARLAAIAALDPARAAAAVDAVRATYAAAPALGAWSVRRVAAAGRVWSKLDASTRAHAAAEVCAAMSPNADLAEAFAQAAAMPDAPESAGLAQVVAATSCPAR